MVRRKAASPHMRRCILAIAGVAVNIQIRRLTVSRRTNNSEAWPLVAVRRVLRQCGNCLLAGRADALASLGSSSAS